MDAKTPAANIVVHLVFIAISLKIENFLWDALYG